MDREERAVLTDHLRRLADGDRASFDPLFTALWPLLRRFAARSLDGSADADDVAQNALLKVLDRVGEYDRERDGLSWVLGIVAYECRTVRLRRTRRREAPENAAAEPADAAPSPESAAIAADLHEAAIEVLATLRPDDVATLRAVSEGRRPDVPPATFRKRVERALHRFRQAWGVHHGSD